jgi:hypothetical protein
MVCVYGFVAWNQVRIHAIQHRCAAAANNEAGLSISPWVTTPASIASADIEVPVGAKNKLPAVVIVVYRVIEENNWLFAGWISLVWIARHQAEARSLVIAIQAGVVDVEISFTEVVWWKSHMKAPTR